MPRRIAAPTRLRRRIFVSFVLVAGLSAGTLAMGSFLLVRQSRLDDSVDRSVHLAQQDVEFARQNLPSDPTTEDVKNRLLDFFATGGIATVALVDGETVASPSSLLSFRPPSDLQALVEDGQIAYERETVLGHPSLVVGGPVTNRDVQLYFVFDESGLRDDLQQLAVVLGAGWVLAVLLAALAGLLLARRTLGPVARASRAARSMAEGLLDTRLPVETDDEFGAWAASFNEMAAALEAKIAALSEARERERRFTSDVAHELRTPLSALVGEASLLREHLDDLPDGARRPAELLVADVARLRKLVEDLMEISRFDAGRQTVRAEPLDLGSLVEATIRSRGWDDRVRVEAQEVVVVSDRRRLERIVANLTGNAVEHGGRDVAVRVGRDGVGAFVEVTDHGPGIRPQDLPHLFERFYKADRSRTGPGSGLGLAIALENAHLLGGDIQVASEPGVGSRFTLRMPAIVVADLLPGREDHVAAPPEDGSRPRERSEP
ncbi:MAG TPA: HAMP domain-containing sensor histidine kinase [Actinomycetota bacterium]